MVARTSHSHPLQIAEVQAGTDSGKIGITFCPGKHDLYAVTGVWARNLDLDLDVIKEWGASLVLTLLETAEMIDLKVPTLGEEIEARGMKWAHLPIIDYSVPDDKFEQHWLMYGKEIRHRLCQGENILVHCKGGLGRAGMISARILVELGTEPEKAIRMVRRARSGAIETYTQLALVKQTTVINEDP
ncbi:cyclin-dependent kinase inhibitor 3 family protein [uncultured Desulfobacter sp.]|uniref:cyclin-dependent kinase inhibitor 3 family protein n=1 Tax=uncultured Desulfobacter sp. TaxID=240139 RepID=UPI0029F51451|nr:cyclin-dependent kinase inhibitor 3 family protein [uncultured Desulfobacter sp.]